MYQRLPENLTVYPYSKIEMRGTTYWLAKGTNGKVLCIAGDTTSFEGYIS